MSRPDPPRWLAGLAVAVLVVGGGAAGWMLWSRPAGPARPSQPSVVLLTLDSTRADRLGSYGYAAAGTPNLDRLAAGGVRFTEAVTPSPLTLPAHASLLTGRYPFSHGVRTDAAVGLDGATPTLAERFSAAGYETAAFVSSARLDRRFGLGRGFAHYDDATDPPRGLVDAHELERRGDRTTAAATAWLAGRATATRPYFLWVHLADAHDPYAPPASFMADFEARPYDGEVAFQDAMVGELLTSAGHGSPASPLVVAAADHGEALGEHGEQTHGLFAYEATLRVPLVVSWPGAIGPRVVTPAVSLVDVAPTIAALAGLPAVQGQDGRSLVPLVDGGAGTGGGSPAYAETMYPHFALGWAPLRSLRDGSWKLIDAPEPELFDLASDPGEQTNRHAARPDIVNRLRRQLDARAPPFATAAAPDPKRMAPIFDRLLDATRAVSRGDADAAERLAREVLAADAANPLAQYVLGRALLGSGRFEESMVALRRVLTTGRHGADAHHWMALARLRLGDRAGALAEEEAALALDARHDAALALRAGLLLSSGRPAESVQSLRDAVTADPLDLSLRVSLADLLADAGLAAEAEPEYRRVLETRPNDAGALVGLGLLLARGERLEPAIALLTRALEIDPGQDEARFQRAVLFERLGRVAEARAGYERLDAPATRPDIRQAAAARLARLP